MISIGFLTSSVPKAVCWQPSRGNNAKRLDARSSVHGKRPNVHNPILHTHCLSLIASFAFRYPHSRTLNLSLKEVTIPHGGAVAADPIRTARYHISLIVGFDDINDIYRA